METDRLAPLSVVYASGSRFSLGRVEIRLFVIELEAKALGGQW